MEAPNVHRLSYLIASSIVKALDVRRVRVERVERELPLVLDEPKPGLRVEILLPEVIRVEGHRRPYLDVDCDLECIVIANGIEVHGCDWAHRLIPLPQEVEALELVLGGGRVDTYGIALERRKSCALRRLSILVLDERIRKLSTALLFLVKMWRSVKDEELRERISSLVNSVLKRVAPRVLDPQRTAFAYRALTLLDPLQAIVATPAVDELLRNLEEAKGSGYVEPSVEELGEACAREYERLLSALDELAREFGKRGAIIPIAQSHLDYLWLWSRESFYVKLGKTFATCLSIASEAPWITTLFTCSHYLEELKRRYPRLFEALAKCVAEGRCYLAGGVWTEFDSNTIDGEALARQFLYGQRTLRELFGREAKILYLPDTFGFPPTLPEVARRGGIEVFIDRKLSWNDTNEFPYMYFRWVAPSGTELVAIYAGHCYTHELDPQKLLRAWAENSERSEVKAIPLLFGYGDGGGGPTIEQVTELEVIDRAPLLPRVYRVGIEWLLKELNRARERLPTWFGELYLENHRGVYSTGMELKRKLKETVTKLKILDALTSSLRLAGAECGDLDKRELDRAWKLVLQSYFHDTASATLSPEAYRSALEEIEEASKLASEGLERLVTRVSKLLPKGIAIFNPVPWKRKALVFVEGAREGLCIDGKPLLTQAVENGVLVEVELPALGFVVLEPCSERSYVEGLEVEERGDEVVVRGRDREFVIGEGGSLRVSLHGFGTVVEKGNEIRVFTDFPREWDAWNIDRDYVDEEIEVEHSKPRVVERGKLRVCVESESRFLSSKVKTLVCVERPYEVARVRAAIGLRDRHVMIKAFFRHSLTAHRAVFEAPLGVFERPLYASTSWDVAKYEVWMGRWVAVSQNDAGFALISPFGSRGLSIGPRYIGYTIARAPTYPHPLLDAGSLEIEYYIYAFRGPWFDAGVHRLAIELELKPLVLRGEGGNVIPVNASVLEVSPSSVAIECVKPCEEGECVVIHGFEACGKSCSLSISSEVARIVGVEECNWQETEFRKWVGVVKPYQALCLKLDLG